MATTKTFDPKKLGMVRYSLFILLLESGKNIDEIFNHLKEYMVQPNYTLNEVEGSIRRMLTALSKKGYFYYSNDFASGLNPDVKEALNSEIKPERWHIVFKPAKIPEWEKAKISLSKKSRNKTDLSLTSSIKRQIKPFPGSRFDTMTQTFTSHGDITVTMETHKLTFKGAVTIVYVHPSNADSVRGIEWGKGDCVSVNNGGFESTINFTKPGGIVFLQTA